LHYPRLSFVSTHPSTPHIHPLSLHDALPISRIFNPCIARASAPFPSASTIMCTWLPSTAKCTTRAPNRSFALRRHSRTTPNDPRSEEHTSELQSRENLVCRLLLEKKKKNNQA